MPDSTLDTIEGLLSAIYDYCGNPPEDKVSPSMILTALYDRIRHYQNELNLTDEGWSLSHKDITTTKGQESVSLSSVPDFGRPFFVETYEPNNFAFKRRQVEMCRLQDRDLYTETYDAPGSSSNANTKHNARVMIFRNMGHANADVLIYPVPSQAAMYRIHYETILTDEPNYQDVPQFMRHFFMLLKVDACMDVLGFCPLSDAQYEHIWAARMAAKTQYYETFYNYIQQAFHEDTGQSRAANSSRRRWRGGR